MEYTPDEAAELLSNALDSVETYVTTFVRLPDASVPAVCAWIAHTYLISNDGFPAGVTPRLGFTSRQRGGGKSTALETVKRLSRNGETVLIPSKAGYMNLIEQQHATICLEEMDKTFPKENSYRDIQAMINAGYSPDGGTITHGNRAVLMHAFVAFAGIGPVLESNPGLAPLWHRTIQVEMIPVHGVRFPEYDSEVHGRATAYLRQVLGSAMEYATLVYGNGLRDLTPPLAETMDGRRDQIWRVLRRIGMAAGGEWNERVERSCADMEAGRSGAAPVLSQQQRIWPDVAQVTRGESQVGTQDLIERLRALPDAPWAFLWPTATSPAVGRELAALLEPHGLLPDTVRVVLPGGLGTHKDRGYRLTDHRVCSICPRDDSYADGFGSDTDEQSSGTDDPLAQMTGSGTDVMAALLGVEPVTPRRPSAVPVSPFRFG
jgi:hypothetical protein